MARNQAVRKAAKAVKRKAAVAEKRKQALAANSLPARVREAARQPIIQCLVSKSLFENGFGVVCLARGVSREEQHFGLFLLDAYALGIKDAFYKTTDREEASILLDSLGMGDPMEPIAPNEARKLMQDLVVWAGGNGFPPAKDWRVLETLFGDTQPAETDYAPRFGRDGKVVYMPGPTESLPEVRTRLATVKERFGDDAVAETVRLVAEQLADVIGDEEFTDEELAEDAFDHGPEIEGELAPPDGDAGSSSQARDDADSQPASPARDDADPEAPSR